MYSLKKQIQKQSDEFPWLSFDNELKHSNVPFLNMSFDVNKQKKFNWLWSDVKQDWD